MWFFLYLKSLVMVIIAWVKCYYWTASYLLILSDSRYFCLLSGNFPFSCIFWALPFLLSEGIHFLEYSIDSNSPRTPDRFKISVSIFRRISILVSNFPFPTTYIWATDFQSHMSDISDSCRFSGEFRLRGSVLASPTTYKWRQVSWDEPVRFRIIMSSFGRISFFTAVLPSPIPSKWRDK